MRNVGQTNMTTSRRKEAEKEEDEPGVITLEVPSISSDYMRTTYNSATGYETSV